MTAAVLSLAPHVAAHLATAIQAHRRACRSTGTAMPVELEELAKVCLEACRGQGRPSSTHTDPSVDVGAMNSRLRTYAGAAEFLAVSETSVKRLVRAGELRPVTIAGAVRFRLEDLEQYVAGLVPRQQPSPAA